MTATVSDLMRKNLITIEESAVQESAKKMMDKNISSLIVVDENSRPIGLITERDLIRKVCIHDAYTSKIITKEIMSSPSEAIDIMLQNNVRHLLVVDNNRSPEDKNKPIGIITPLDFTRSQGYAGSDNNDTVEKLLEYYI